MEIANHSIEPGDFAAGLFLPDVSEEFDAVLFCEILEHITFNPIEFWRRIHQLLRVGGIIYVTTPNSLRLIALMGAFWNLLSLSRIGISVPQIFRHVTFGHHWKEYSARELMQYFPALSRDFHVAVRRMHYGPVAENVRRQIGPARTLLLSLGNATGFFADNLEAVVTLRKRSPWTVIPPDVA
jgi:2-polyprenyl-6-hydroxyphenyl methylase/3-demethylubiquinone-9 3-methyltransferase